MCLLRSCSVAILAVAMAAGAAGCGPDRTPRRVPDDGAPCSVVMPGSPESEEGTLRLGIAPGGDVVERAWSLRQPDASLDPPKDFTTYVVRRGVVPAGAAL